AVIGDAWFVKTAKQVEIGAGDGYGVALMPILSACCKADCLMKGKMPSEHCSDGIFKWKTI
ncbi:hypothetical protein M5Z72_11195, partial [Neisseria meningitidis]|nr:hypothetical protein [Neisseria meningitidis]